MPKIRVTTTDLSFFFGLPILAYSEWRFGVEVLGLPEAHLWGMTLSLALFVPGFLDTYVVAAMRRGGSEVGWALALVVMSVTGSAVAHLYELSAEQKVLASAIFGCMLAVVIWRVKHIAHVDSSSPSDTQDVVPEDEGLCDGLQQDLSVPTSVGASRDGASAKAMAGSASVANTYEPAERSGTGERHGVDGKPKDKNAKKAATQNPPATDLDEARLRRARRAAGMGSRARRDEQALMVLSEKPGVTGPELSRELSKRGWPVSDRTGARILAGLRHDKTTAGGSAAGAVEEFEQGTGPTN